VFFLSALDFGPDDIIEGWLRVIKRAIAKGDSEGVYRIVRYFMRRLKQLGIIR
jgi:hypothetical protein